MIDLSNIREAFRERLLTLDQSSYAQANGHASFAADAINNVLWENRGEVPISPQNHQVWIQEMFQPDQEVKTASDTIESLGITNFDCVYPRKEGTQQAELLAKLIVEHFKVGTALTRDGTNVIIYRAERRPGLFNPGTEVWYKLPVRLSWRGFATP